MADALHADFATKESQVSKYLEELLLTYQGLLRTASSISQQEQPISSQTTAKERSAAPPPLEETQSAAALRDQLQLLLKGNDELSSRRDELHEARCNKQAEVLLRLQRYASPYRSVVKLPCELFLQHSIDTYVRMFRLRAASHRHGATASIALPPSEATDCNETVELARLRDETAALRERRQVLDLQCRQLLDRLLMARNVSQSTPLSRCGSNEQQEGVEDDLVTLKCRLQQLKAKHFALQQLLAHRLPQPNKRT